MSNSDQMAELRFICEQMRAIEARKDELEAALKEVNKEYDNLRLRVIPEKMEALGVKNVTFEGLGRVQLASDLYASTREGQKEAGIQWLRDCGYDGMISETYNASFIKALFRRMIEQGAEIPDSIFNVTPFIRASIVKS